MTTRSSYSSGTVTAIVQLNCISEVLRQFAWMVFDRSVQEMSVG